MSHGPACQIGGPPYLQTLSLLSSSHNFFSPSGPGALYHDSASYRIKASWMTGVMCVLMKQAFEKRIEGVGEAMKATNVENGGVIKAETLDASVIYTKFHGISTSR